MSFLHHGSSFQKQPLGRPQPGAYLKLNSIREVFLGISRKFQKTIVGPDPLILHFLKIFVFEKSYSFFKLIFKATQLQKIPEYDIFQKILFCISASSMNFGLNTVPVEAGQYL